MKSKPKGTFLRLILPDSHGQLIDPRAEAALFADLDELGDQVEEIVDVGDLLDVGGDFNSHPRSFNAELDESYQEDCYAGNLFLDGVQGRCPNAKSFDYIEGNHEWHVERFATRAFKRKVDADMLLDKFGPQAMLDLKGRGIKYYRRSEFYQGIGIQGTIRKGKCYFTHGISASKHATSVHLERFADNVVHGHTHRAAAIIGRTVRSSCIGAWCPGTLAKIQPLYNHTNPTTHSHGYALQFVSRTGGSFLHFNVPIFEGKSLLHEVTSLRK